jgi:hypothetical protein
MTARIPFCFAFAVGATGGAARAERRVSAAVSQAVRPLIAQMASDIRYEDKAPPLAVVPLSNAVQLEPAKGVEPGGAARYDIKGLRAGERLQLLALLPVSGQVGWESAKSSAKKNRYNLVIEHADGTHEVLPKVVSEGLVTQKQLSLKVKPGKTVITYWAEGPDVVAGSRAGRMIELNYTPEQ